MSSPRQDSDSKGDSEDLGAEVQRQLSVRHALLVRRTHFERLWAVVARNCADTHAMVDFADGQRLRFDSTAALEAAVEAGAPRMLALRINGDNVVPAVRIRVRIEAVLAFTAEVQMRGPEKWMVRMRHDVQHALEAPVPWYSRLATSDLVPILGVVAGVALGSVLSAILQSPILALRAIGVSPWFGLAAVLIASVAVCTTALTHFRPRLFPRVVFAVTSGPGTPGPMALR